MQEILSAMAISGGILLGVVIFLTFVVMVAVKRGEVQMHEDEAKQGGHKTHH
jgi:hypothetical protein